MVPDERRATATAASADGLAVVVADGDALMVTVGVPVALVVRIVVPFAAAIAALAPIVVVVGGAFAVGVPVARGCRMSGCPALVLTRQVFYARIRHGQV